MTPAPFCHMRMKSLEEHPCLIMLAPYLKFQPPELRNTFSVVYQPPKLWYLVIAAQRD